MSNEQTSNEAYNLFLGALDVTNKALDSLRDKPVVDKLVKLMDDNADGKKFGVAVYKSDVDAPYAYFTVRLQNKQFQLVSQGKDAPEIDWKVSQDYLKDINDNPQEYIDTPLKLDTDWLQHRLRDAA